MHIARIIVRMLVGLLFIAAGLSAFLVAPPPQPGLMGGFSDLFYRSHWTWFIGFVQFVLGVLFVIDRFVPVAVILLAAFLYNSFAFHVTTSPPFAIVPVVLAALLVFIAWPYRAAFTALFTAR